MGLEQTTELSRADYLADLDRRLRVGRLLTRVWQVVASRVWTFIVVPDCAPLAGQSVSWASLDAAHYLSSARGGRSEDGSVRSSRRKLRPLTPCRTLGHGIGERFDVVYAAGMGLFSSSKRLWSLMEYERITTHFHLGDAPGKHGYDRLVASFHGDVTEKV